MSQHILKDKYSDDYQEWSPDLDQAYRDKMGALEIEKFRDLLEHMADRVDDLENKKNWEEPEWRVNELEDEVQRLQRKCNSLQQIVTNMVAAMAEAMNKVEKIHDKLEEKKNRTEADNMVLSIQE